MTKKIYLASPLGFSPENDAYRRRVKERLSAQGLSVLDPWEVEDFLPAVDAAYATSGCAEREELFRAVAAEIGGTNERLIREADLLLAVLDGAEVDSGTASEVGFAAALGKTCYGLRTDLRNSGDFPGIAVNLQVLHFIDRSGGRLFRRIDDVVIE